MSLINEYCDRIASFMWGPFTLILIIGIGIYLTFITGFFQMFNCKDIFKNTIGSIAKKSKKAIENVNCYSIKHVYYLLDNIKDKFVGFCYDAEHHHLYNLIDYLLSICTII